MRCIIEFRSNTTTAYIILLAGILFTVGAQQHHVQVIKNKNRSALFIRKQPPSQKKLLLSWDTR